jgi:hypothetical protein
VGEELIVKVDPAASMRIWEVQLMLGGQVFTIPAMSAADWWPILADGDLTGLLDVAESNSTDLDEMLLSGELEGTDISEALVEAVEAATGRSYRVAVVLVSVAAQHWGAINGYLVARGFRWDQQPIGAALDAIYSVTTQNMNEKDLSKFGQAMAGDGARPEVAEEFEQMAGPKPKRGTAIAGPSGNARPRTRRRPRQPLQGGPSGAPSSPPEQPAGSDPQTSSARP